MFRPNWPSSGVYYVRSLLGCNVVCTALASVSYLCVVYDSVCGCLVCSYWVVSMLSCCPATYESKPRTSQWHPIPVAMDDVYAVIGDLYANRTAAIFLVLLW
jgi:hypothetical protein